MSIDLDTVAADWLQRCGSCDAGLLNGCTCNGGDYRPTMAALVNELIVNRAELSQASGDRAALDVAVGGLRELETRFAENSETAAHRADEHVAQAWDIARGTVSGLLDKIGATR